MSVGVLVARDGRSRRELRVAAHPDGVLCAQVHILRPSVVSIKDLGVKMLTSRFSRKMVFFVVHHLDNDTWSKRHLRTGARAARAHTGGEDALAAAYAAAERARAARGRPRGGRAGRVGGRETYAGKGRLNVRLDLLDAVTVGLVALRVARVVLGLRPAGTEAEGGAEKAKDERERVIDRRPRANEAPSCKHGARSAGCTRSATAEACMGASRAMQRTRVPSMATYMCAQRKG